MRAGALAVTLAVCGAGACDAGPSPHPSEVSAPRTQATAAAGASGESASHAPPPFADAAGPVRLDRAPQAVTLDGGRMVELSSWRFEPAPGRSELRNTYWCGVGVEGQALTVIGVGHTETVSCDGMADAGAVPGGRIGLIYRTSSPNAQSLTAVVVVKAEGAWAIDEPATERLLAISPATVDAMRKVIQ